MTKMTYHITIGKGGEGVFLMTSPKVPSTKWQHYHYLKTLKPEIVILASTTLPICQGHWQQAFPFFNPTRNF
jgi:hypothetical protein